MLPLTFGFENPPTYKFKLLTLAKNGGFAVPIFPLLIFIKKNSGHN